MSLISHSFWLQENRWWGSFCFVKKRGGGYMENNFFPPAKLCLKKGTRMKNINTDDYCRTTQGLQRSRSPGNKSLVQVNGIVFLQGKLPIRRGRPSSPLLPLFVWLPLCYGFWAWVLLQPWFSAEILRTATNPRTSCGSLLSVNKFTFQAFHQSNLLRPLGNECKEYYEYANKKSWTAWNTALELE